MEMHAIPDETELMRTCNMPLMLQCPRKFEEVNFHARHDSRRIRPNAPKLYDLSEKLTASSDQFPRKKIEEKS